MTVAVLMNLGFAAGTAAVLVTVPDVVGQTQASATTELEGDGFVVAVSTAYSSSVAAGLVISQSPTAGSSASSGSTVTITVSLGELATQTPRWNRIAFRKVSRVALPRKTRRVA